MNTNMNFNLDSYVQYIGHVATLLIILSATMRTIVKLRVVNLLGSLLFIVYSIMIDSLPVLILNVVIAGVHTFYLIRIYSRTEQINLHRVSSDQLTNLDFYNSRVEDIRKFFGKVNTEECKDIFLVFKQEKIAGILAGTIINQTFDIKIDYVTREFRNFQIGKSLFVTQKEILRSLGISRVISRSLNKLHIRYLHKMGFMATDMENYYSLNL